MLRIPVDRDAMVALCQRWQIAELSIFGSALRDDCGPASDVDILVSFDGAARPTLFDLVRLQAELEWLLGRPVDLVERRAIERSPNHIRRRAILESAELVYAA